MRILAIETSCDETAAAVVERDVHGMAHIRSNIVFGQMQEHEAFGGVVPEIAARAHLSVLDKVIRAAIDEAGCSLAEVDAIAATAGPGLIGGLMVGVMTAKGLAASLDKPFMAINHLEGHALTARLTDHVDYPYLLLLVSGGHTQILEIAGLGDYRRMASTIDDALGEAFDKTAKLLSLGFPGGPAVEAAARNGNPLRFRLPHPLKGQDTLNFSFSGLKTAIRTLAQELAPLDERNVNDLCASFQKTVAEIVGDRAGRAMADFARRHPDIRSPVLVVAGGVSANQGIRASLLEASTKKDWRFVAPPLALCGDNAAMIGWAAAERLAAGEVVEPDFAPRSRWPLDGETAPVIGSGRRGAKA
ncbi:MAG: tRNA (adenosine(37)-N6)-threonylcarbamoyltransferase complex transferase subunit TsaD [Nitratireductor sp.]|nr:tRNA (adenosine(37)-N6)-threonylcarbamoyltransferase complex transferase subunit TsaD [Nitratireductor sp.]